MSEQKPLNRREFLERAAMLGAMTMGAGTLLAACEPAERDTAERAQPAEQPTAEANGDFTCNAPEDVAGLTEAQMQTREVNNYVDQTEIPEQRCDNCGLWTDPAPGENCGGCTVVQGPIHPAGWCSIWVPAA